MFSFGVPNATPQLRSLVRSVLEAMIDSGGAHLFGRPDHDTDLFREKLGEIPLGGFFCNGEIGRVGGATFLHGYTSSFALFLEESSA